MTGATYTGNYVDAFGFYWPYAEHDDRPGYYSPYEEHYGYDDSRMQNTRNSYFFEIPRSQNLSLQDVDLSSLEYEVDGDFLNIQYLHSQGNSYVRQDIQASIFQELQRPKGGSEKTMTQISSLLNGLRQAL